MSDQTGIEWTDATWNPVTGCSKVSPGCKNCYAERLALRLQAMRSPRYRRGFAVSLHPDLLNLPLRWRTPRHIFVNSMSDLFHDEVPDEFIIRVFETMTRPSWHTFQVLTKRSQRLVSIAPRLPWPENVWQGVSVESNRYTGRINDLCRVTARIRFVSVEPLLGPMPALPLDGIDWVIVGGESGGGRRPIEAHWVRDIRDQCVRRSIPFFFKQWGGRTPKAGGRSLDGESWEQRPATEKT